ncbi:PREDICTED: zinc finger protein 888-like isoform X2 [Papilio polytes]|uniref:zinc finger protein 888-like isoform X2 n=1 Tax=Papilio polytes TaxID=76194 RepID=UPI000675E591|nr:PREDICTED: zinc finger protein 888-like isoform X2 [Papilio polytes]
MKFSIDVEDSHRCRGTHRILILFLILHGQHHRQKMLLPVKCIKGVICDSIVRLQVPAKILHKHIVDLEYMNYTPLELFEIIKSKKTKEITEACNKSNTNKTTSVNKCRNLEQSVITKKLNKKQIITRTVNNLQDDIDFDVESNNAFQVQLDAEIQRDVEIEKQISKVFEASDCYKKFLDKEANDPIDDTYDVLDNTVSNNDEYLNTDTSTEENSDTDIQNENQSDMEYNEIFKCNIKTNVDKMEDCNSNKEKSKQEVNESIKKVEKENINKKDTDLINLNITEDNLISKDSGSEIEKSDITKDFNDKVTSDYLNAVDNLDTDIKTDPSINIKIDTFNTDIDGISDNIVPKYSDNYIKINTENISEPKYSCSDCKYTGNYKQYVDHSISCINKYINCIYCMKSFQNIKSFLNHFPEHKLTYLSCPQCFEKFNDIINLKNHILTHIYELFHLPNSGYEGYKCSLCEESVDIDKFFIHWESHLQLNEGNMDIDNEIEVKKIMTPEMVKQALVILTKIRNHNLLCIVCSKMFTNSIKLKRHLINHLLYEVKIDMLNGAKLTCPKCRIDIKDIDNWIIHMEQHSHLHSIYFCKSCRKSYKDPILFDQHKEMHKKKYVCDICGKKFFVESLIIQHLENHEPVKIITCQICDEVFRFQSQYKSHDCMPLLRFSCTLCERKFRTCKDKLNHLWNKHKFSRHSADCTLCDKKYRRLRDLRCHLKMKHGIKRSDEFDRLRE